MKKETKVNCEVESCKYNEDELCCLEELEISCTCDNDECEEVEETICRSFEKRDELDEGEELEYDLDDDGYEIEYVEDDKDFEEELDDDYDEELDKEVEENEDEEIIDTYIEKEDY